MNSLPMFESYGNYSDKMGNIRALVFSFGSFEIYYSYKTPVAFRHNGRLVVRENDWGPTTGKHLNWIDGGNKSGRIQGGEFELELAGIMAGL